LFHFVCFRGADIEKGSIRQLRTNNDNPVPLSYSNDLEAQLGDFAVRRSEIAAGSLGGEGDQNVAAAARTTLTEWQSTDLLKRPERSGRNRRAGWQRLPAIG
jgi:hypothetical protein